MGDFWCPWYDVAWEINWRIIKLNENSILYLFLANSLWSVLLRINKNTMKVNSFDLASWTLFIREPNILPLDFKSKVFVFCFQTHRKQFQIEVVLKPLYAFLILWKKKAHAPQKRFPVFTFSVVNYMSLDKSIDLQAVYLCLSLVPKYNGFLLLIRIFFYQGYPITRFFFYRIIAYFESLGL